MKGNLARVRVRHRIRLMVLLLSCSSSFLFYPCIIAIIPFPGDIRRIRLLNSETVRCLTIEGSFYKASSISREMGFLAQVKCANFEHNLTGQGSEFVKYCFDNKWSSQFPGEFPILITFQMPSLSVLKA